MRMLTTLLRPTGGTATVAGHDLLADPRGVRRRIGYVLEAVRDLFGGRYATWAVAAGVAVTLLLSVVCVTAGTRVFNRENA